MKVDLLPGAYVIAVSGGVDSMVLLDVLARQYGGNQGYGFVVAHFDHGIRSDSAEDRRLVQRTAAKLEWPFACAMGRLGKDASEALARSARYDFLHAVQRASNARAVITAHHQDDVVETAILNLLRGTGRRGLTSLRSGADRLRPLLHVPKADILEYAAKHSIVWHEDSTNTDLAYLRNYVRHTLVSRLTLEQRNQLLGLLAQLAPINEEIDLRVAHLLSLLQYDNVLDRAKFGMLPHAVAREIVVAYLRYHDVPDVDTKGIERLVVVAKTACPGTVHDVKAGWSLKVGREALALCQRDR